MIKKVFLLVIFILILLNSASISLALNTEYNLTYDNNGNLIQGFDKYFEYNDFNQLEHVRENDAVGIILVEYSYDHDGNRIRKIEYQGNENTTTYYLENFIRVVNSSGTFDEVYYYHDDTLIGKKDYDGEKYFYHPDHLGSTNLVTNENGDVVEETNYLPYGEIIEGGQSRYSFTGKEKDIETGLMYYGARYYDTTMRQFVQPDLIIQDFYNPQSLNRYAYVLNNPYKYTDPDGRIVVYVGGLGMAGSGIGVGGSTGIAVSWTPSEGLEVGRYSRKGGGVITPTLSGSIEVGISPFQKNLQEFSGRTFDIGGDVGEFVTVGGGVSIPYDKGNLKLSKFVVEGTFAPTLTDLNPPVLFTSGYGMYSDTSIDYIYGGTKEEVESQFQQNNYKTFTIKDLNSFSSKFSNEDMSVESISFTGKIDSSRTNKNKKESTEDDEY